MENAGHATFVIHFVTHMLTGQAYGACISITFIIQLFMLTSNTEVWCTIMFLLILKLSHIIVWFELVMRLMFPSAGQVCKIIYGYNY